MGATILYFMINGFPGSSWRRASMRAGAAPHTAGTGMTGLTLRADVLYLQARGSCGWRALCGAGLLGLRCASSAGAAFAAWRALAVLRAGVEVQPYTDVA